jgi:urease accessory protein
MLLGGVLAFLGVPLPRAEWGICLSVIVLGLAVAMSRSLPLWAAASLVGLFAIFHGHAHVAELGTSAVLPCVIGFTVTTLALQAAAIAAGTWATRSGGVRVLRVAGGAIAAGFALVLLAAA